MKVGVLSAWGNAYKCKELCSEPIKRFDETIDSDCGIVIVEVKNSLSFWRLLHKRNAKLTYILEAKSPIPDLLSRYRCLNYIGIIGDFAHLLWKRSQPILLGYNVLPSLESFMVEKHQFKDYFLEPLQPLTLQMDLNVYSNFEKDKTKYAQYDEAIALAMLDLRLKHRHIDVLVVGPGRGPLVSRVLTHAREGDSITAIERNPKCIDLLKTRNETEWSGRVTVVHGDARNHSDHHHLVVSELLGSFGCNEAAPEVLKALRCDVCIPASYTNYLQPIYTPTRLGFKRPYLVDLDTYFATADPLPVFAFEHPGAVDLQQTKTLCYNSEDTSNALLGYFSANLYGPFNIGILPGMHDIERCSSWFPMIFPIEAASGPIEVRVSRHHEENRFWYEWLTTSLWNESGSAYSIALS